MRRFVGGLAKIALALILGGPVAASASSALGSYLREVDRPATGREEELAHEILAQEKGTKEKASKGKATPKEAKKAAANIDRKSGETPPPPPPTGRVLEKKR